MPKFLEEKLGSEAGTAGRVESLQEYCFYTFAGYVTLCRTSLAGHQLTSKSVDRLPGSLVGAYLEQRVGKKEAMAMATLGTALGVLGFVFVSSQFAVLIATMCISFMGGRLQPSSLYPARPADIRSLSLSSDTHVCHYL